MMADCNFKGITASDDRANQLVTWLTDTLGSSILSLQFASEDASFRRYFRAMEPGRTFIVMDAPPDKMSTEPFIRIARKFRDLGINTPEIDHFDAQQGFVMMTDFGSQTYFDALNPANADTLYAAALDTLVQLQAAPAAQLDGLPLYDTQLLRSEMELFPDWYLPHQLDTAEITDLDATLNAIFDQLIASALEQPQVCVHLDYHSRNLMHLPGQPPGVIDFQDARIGPLTYDLVSLLRDCYIVWPREKVADWIAQYLQKAKHATAIALPDRHQLMQWFDWMGLQRHIKVAGIFTRLHDRDQKARYLRDIPTVLNYIETVSRQYRELKPLHDLIVRIISR